MTTLEAFQTAWNTADDVKKRAAVLDVLKQQRAAALASMKSVLTQVCHGLPAMYRLSDDTDNMIAALLTFVAQTVFPLRDGEEMPALVACGGYGRRELAPYSDIDVLFLVPSVPDAVQTERLMFIVCLLTDAGLKVGYAVRTPDDCISEAVGDTTVCTNLLETRFVTGNERLFYTLLERYEIMKASVSRVAFVNAKKTERDARYARMGESRYMLEPNVKEGRGGLRDLHLLFWLMKYLFNITDLRELVDRGILDSKTVDLFLKAHDFLDTVRCYLHFYRGKHSDILTMDAQKAIAPLLGYADRKNGLSAVERFMKHYYIICRSVGVLMYYFTAVVEDALRDDAEQKTLSADPRFCLNNGRIAFQDGYSPDPDMFLKAFWLKRELKADISPKTLQTIAAHSKNIRTIRKTPEACRLFFDILLSENASEILHKMLDSGVLGEFIPVFKPLIGQMQFDMYHLYTTDEHTLKTVEHLSFFEKTPFAPAPQSRRTLYVAALLHDIGKGTGGNHAEKGAALAVKALTDLRLSAEESETVLWLIRHHLLMSETAFRRDIFDLQTVNDFVKTVQSPERLRLLYALTGADIMAVAPNVWNGFKERLLTDLMKNALNVMQGDALRPRALTAGQQFLLTQKEKISPNDVLFDIRTDSLQGVTEVAVLTSDREGLFAAVTGAMALVGVSVVGAEITTLPDNTALDSFLVQDTDASLLDKNLTTPLTSEKKIKRLKETILQALTDGASIAEKVEQKRLSTPKGPVAFSPRVLVDDDASRDCTLIEVNGTDCVGFLHAVTHTMTKLRLTIVSAHVYTYGTHVVDVFYVRDEKGRKLSDATTRRRVSDALSETLKKLG